MNKNYVLTSVKLAISTAPKSKDKNSFNRWAKRESLSSKNLAKNSLPTKHIRIKNLNYREQN